MRLALFALFALSVAGCSARPLALPLPDGGLDLATSDLGIPCSLSGRYDGALHGAIDTTFGCAVFSIYEGRDQISGFVLDNFPKTASPTLKTNLDLPGLVVARTYRLGDLKNGRIEVDDQHGAYWVVGFAADGTATGKATLELASVAGGASVDPRGRPTFEVHGKLDAVMSSGTPGGADLTLHVDF